MLNYIIVELPDGLSALELPDGQKPEDAAIAQGGLLVDEGPFRTLEEAIDAINSMGAEDERA